MGREDRIAYHLEIHEERWEEWKEQKDSDVEVKSMAEFIRMFVEAGRRYFSQSSPFPEDDQQMTKEKVKDVMRDSEEEYTSWERLRERFIEDIEEELDQTLSEMEGEEEIELSRRKGGYRLDDEG